MDGQLEMSHSPLQRAQPINPFDALLKLNDIWNSKDLSATEDVLQNMNLFSTPLTERLQSLCDLNSKILLSVEPGALEYFALHLLAHAKVTTAFSAAVSLIKQPRKILDAYFGDALTESFSSALASLYDGNPQELANVALDKKLDFFSRTAAFEALALVSQSDEKARRTAFEIANLAINNIHDAEDIEIALEFIATLMPLENFEIEKEVKEAFKNGKFPLENYILSANDFEKEMRGEQNIFRTWGHHVNYPFDFSLERKRIESWLVQDTESVSDFMSLMSKMLETDEKKKKKRKSQKNARKNNRKKK